MQLAYQSHKKDRLERGTLDDGVLGSYREGIVPEEMDRDAKAAYDSHGGQCQVGSLS